MRGCVRACFVPSVGVVPPFACNVGGGHSSRLRIWGWGPVSGAQSPLWTGPPWRWTGPPWRPAGIHSQCSLSRILAVGPRPDAVCVHPSPCLFLVSCCLQLAPCPKCCLVQDAPKQELHSAALVAKSLRYRGPWGTLRLQGASGPPPLPAHLSIRTNGWHALGENALRLVPADRAAEHRHWRDSRRRSQL